MESRIYVNAPRLRCLNTMMRLYEVEDDRRTQVLAMQARLPARWRNEDGTIAHKNWRFESWLAKQSDDQLPDIQRSLATLLSYLAANPKAKMRVAYTRTPKAKLTTLRMMVARTGKGFQTWLRNSYADPIELQRCQRNARCLVNELEEYLTRDLGITVRSDGLIAFWTLNRETELLIGMLPVVLYHFTSSRMLRSIRAHGLEGDRETINYRETSGVYLTTEQSGPAVRGYVGNAVRHHGGHGVMLTVRCYLSELEPDPDDANISSGRTQFMMDYVPPDRILSIERSSV